MHVCITDLYNSLNNMKVKIEDISNIGKYESIIKEKGLSSHLQSFLKMVNENLIPDAGDVDVIATGADDPRVEKVLAYIKPYIVSMEKSVIKDIASFSDNLDNLTNMFLKNMAECKKTFPGYLEHFSESKDEMNACILDKPSHETCSSKISSLISTLESMTLIPDFSKNRDDILNNLKATETAIGNFSGLKIQDGYANIVPVMEKDKSLSAKELGYTHETVTEMLEQADSLLAKWEDIGNNLQIGTTYHAFSESLLAHKPVKETFLNDGLEPDKKEDDVSSSEKDKEHISIENLDVCCAYMTATVNVMDASLRVMKM